MSGWVLCARQCRQLCFTFVIKQANNTVFRHVRLVRHNVALLPKVDRHCYRLMSRESKIDSTRPDTKNDLISDLNEPKDDAKDLSKKTGRQKLALVFAKYGVTAVVFHTCISLASLGLCYIAVSRTDFDIRSVNNGEQKHRLSASSFETGIFIPFLFSDFAY